jgi:hypothetical protein
MAADGLAAERLGRGPAWAAPLAWGLASLGLLIVVLGLLLWAGRDFGPLPVSFGRSLTGVIGLVVSALTYTTLGALLAARIPRNPLGWLVLGCGVLLSSMLPINLVVAMAHEALRPPAPIVVTLAWLRTVFATPGVALLLIVAMYLFPTGRPLNRAWWLPVIAAIVGGAGLAAGVALNRDGLVTYPTLPNPTQGPLELQWAIKTLQAGAVAILAISAVLAVAHLGLRYRAGDPLGRVQLRWILFAAALTVATALPFLLTRYVIDVGDELGELFALAAQLGISTLPIAAAFAISRYRLYDVDLLIGHTLVYVPLMAILGGLYTAAITVFQRLFVALTGNTSDGAVVLTVLLVASAFTPLRRAIEAVLLRRFANGSGRDSSATASPAQPSAESAERRPEDRAWTGAVPIVTVRPIGADGRVECPRRHVRVPIGTCLACDAFLAIGRGGNGSVVCAFSGAD